MYHPHISNDENHFFVDLRGEGWGVFFAFNRKELEKGASLARMMNEKVRATLVHGSAIISTEELISVARTMLPLLRKVVDDAFAPRR